MMCHNIMNIFVRISIVYLCFIQLTSAAWLRCYKGSLNEYQATPLDKELPQSFLSCLDPNLPIMVYTFGYRGRSNGPATTAVLTVYIATKKRNVLLLDWEEEAKSGLLGIPLSYAFSAVPHSKKAGREMGERLIDLAKAGFNMTNIHLIGHSLGAHIMGFAGRQSREKGFVVKRITGLDPARALFEGTFAVQRGLDRTCARFVDILHSDPGGYGTSTSTGSVDIWPNNAGLPERQPGCEIGDFSMFTPEDKDFDQQENSVTDGELLKMKKLNYIMEIIRYALRRPNLCSHDRSWRYYVEAIASPTAIVATSAPDYASWLAKHDDSNVTIYLGDLISNRAQGNFYFTTNSEPPFSRGMEGLKPNNSKPNESHHSITRTRLFNYFR